MSSFKGGRGGKTPASKIVVEAETDSISVEPTRGNFKGRGGKRPFQSNNPRKDFKRAKEDTPTSVPSSAGPSSSLLLQAIVDTPPSAVRLYVREEYFPNFHGLLDAISAEYRFVIARDDRIRRIYSESEYRHTIMAIVQFRAMTIKYEHSTLSTDEESYYEFFKGWVQPSTVKVGPLVYLWMVNFGKVETSSNVIITPHCYPYSVINAGSVDAAEDTYWSATMDFGLSLTMIVDDVNPGAAAAAAYGTTALAGAYGPGYRKIPGGEHPEISMHRDRRLAIAAYNFVPQAGTWKDRYQIFDDQMTDYRAFIDKISEHINVTTIPSSTLGSRAQFIRTEFDHPADTGRYHKGRFEFKSVSLGDELTNQIGRIFRYRSAKPLTICYGGNELGDDETTDSSDFLTESVRINDIESMTAALREAAEKYTVRK